MALIVEDGTGLATAEAYISVADATTYHTAYGNPASWTAATTTAKEIALRTGAQYLDAYYALRWLGTRTNELQALDWPRIGGIDHDEFVIEDDDVPEEVRRANAIAALKHIDGDVLLPDLTSPGTIGSERFKVAVLEKDVTYLGGKSPLKQYSLIQFILTRVLRRSSSVALA